MLSGFQSSLQKLFTLYHLGNFLHSSFNKNAHLKKEPIFL